MIVVGAIVALYVAVTVALAFWWSIDMATEPLEAVAALVVSTLWPVFLVGLVALYIVFVAIEALGIRFDPPEEP